MKIAFIYDQIYPYIVGGARMFNIKRSAFFNVGRRNLQSVKSILDDFSIMYFELKIGGTKGRRVVFNCGNGDININTV